MPIPLTPRVEWLPKAVSANSGKPTLLLLGHEFVNISWGHVIWSLAYGTNHNNQETRNKPTVSLDLSRKSPSMNDHCCPSRSTAS